MILTCIFNITYCILKFGKNFVLEDWSHCSLTFLLLTESIWFGTLNWSAKVNFLSVRLKKHFLKEIKFHVHFNNFTGSSRPLNVKCLLKTDTPHFGETKFP